LFGAKEEKGLTDILRDSALEFEQLVMPTNVPGFSILPAGSPDDHAAEHLASDRMTELCVRLSEEDEHRIIVFDSSPLLVTTEASVLASQVGQIALVVQAGRTSQSAVLAAIEKLDHNKAINLILNQASRGGWLNAYGNDYGYGYGYGHDESRA
jgi:Mrp family chromosome partitioning ATPase